jgi:hypothetical protein
MIVEGEEAHKQMQRMCGATSSHHCRYCNEPYMKPVCRGNEKRSTLPVAALDEEADDPAVVSVETLPERNEPMWPASQHRTSLSSASTTSLHRLRATTPEKRRNPHARYHQHACPDTGTRIGGGKITPRRFPSGLSAARRTTFPPAAGDRPRRADRMGPAAVTLWNRD